MNKWKKWKLKEWKEKGKSRVQRVKEKGKEILGGREGSKEEVKRWKKGKKAWKKGMKQDLRKKG